MMSIFKPVIHGTHTAFAERKLYQVIFLDYLMLNMLPDYTLSISPGEIDMEQAEKEDLIVHIHFDAKYRVKCILPYNQQRSTHVLLCCYFYFPMQNIFLTPIYVFVSA